MYVNFPIIGFAVCVSNLKISYLYTCSNRTSLYLGTLKWLYR